MKGQREGPRQEIALFRYHVISELLVLPPGSKALGAGLRERAERTYVIPGSQRIRVSQQTIRDWIRLYREGGFDALHPKHRSDSGKTRKMDAAISELLIATKRNNFNLGVADVIAVVRSSGEVAADVRLAPSTVHRLLSREGLMVRDNTTPQDRQRFAFPNANDLWMSDVMHGPKCGAGGGRRNKSYLTAFIDDATRQVPHTAFAFSENTVAFQAVFKQALINQGLPTRLYVDNGSAYKSRQLAVICAKLGIHLIHARPYQPAGKGKIERFFRTLRGRFLNRLKPEDSRDLDTLNQRLQGWVEAEYHRTSHRGLDGMTPRDKWCKVSSRVRYPHPGLDLDDMFLFEAGRKVSKDRVVTLDNHLYQVDAALIGKRVILRFDPEAPPSQPLKVVLDGLDVGEATPLDIHANATARRGGNKRQRPASSISFHDLGRKKKEDD